LALIPVSGGPDPVVYLDVVRSYVEAEPGEGVEAHGEALLMGAVEDKIDLGNPDVVLPHVNLFHGLIAHRKLLS